MSAPEQTETGPPRVFISYSHDSREHCDRVLTLAQQLRRDGIDAELDQFHQDELLHWPRWCEEQLRPENSDFVLCVCTEEYKRRVEGRVPADVGKGVFWEGTLIYNYLYDEKDNQRCVPILLSKAGGADIPSILSGYTRFRLETFGLDDVQSDYSKMYRLLTRQPGVEKAALGEILRLPPLPAGERHPEFARLIEQILAGIVEVKSDTRKILSILEDRTPPSSTPGRPHNLPPWMAPEYFIGRGKELRALCDGFAAQGGGALAVVQPQVVRGGGGIGKTRLAVQAVWVLYLQGKCDMAFYVSASSLGEIDTQLAALSEKSLLNLYKESEAPRDLETRRQDAIHALRQHAGRWILLIDAADSEAARDTTNKLLKELAGGRFVITSRRDDWPKATVHTLTLDLFTPEEARACLRSRYWKAEPSTQELADFDRVADELGHLPLALALAGSYMYSSRISPARYLEEWREKHDRLLAFSAPDVDYDRSLLAAFELSYGQLDAAAAALLGLLAWLAPEPFPRRLVEDSERVRDILSATAEGSEKPDTPEALAQLRTLSLIQLDEESLRLHKLVLECAREVLPEQTRRKSIAAALGWLAASLPDTEFDEAGWELWSRLAPHLDGMVETAERFHVEEETVA